MMKRVRLAGIVLATALAFAATANAADIAPDSLKLAAGVVKAAGYETPETTYIVANGTNLYNDHSFYNTKVTGELKRGDHVDVLAKVKGWDWALVGKDGTGHRLRLDFDAFACGQIRSVSRLGWNWRREEQASSRFPELGGYE